MFEKQDINGLNVFVFQNIIGTGEENATSKTELMEKLGIKTVRGLYKELADARRSGQVILSSQKGGFYTPVSVAEIDEFINRSTARSKSNMMVLESAKRWRKQLQDFKNGEQLTLDLHN